jgi:poly(3-hydroxybutyrate) depolymerase
MRSWQLYAVSAALSFAAANAQAEGTTLERKTASGHPMQYFVSLPHDWVKGKVWPVVVVIEGANRRFRENAELFVRARHKMPFIIVAPLVTTNGGTNYRRMPSYQYSNAVWDQVERDGRCQFDLDGVAAVLRDVQQLYGGEEKYFLTGFEAGGHLVWAMVFKHPEALRAAAPSCPNYIGRCMEDDQFSSSPARADLPVKVFLATAGAQAAPNRNLQTQSEKAKQTAEAHGYRQVSLTQIAEKGHGPLPDEVMAYFASLLTGAAAK